MPRIASIEDKIAKYNAYVERSKNLVKRYESIKREEMKRSAKNGTKFRHAIVMERLSNEFGLSTARCYDLLKEMGV